MERQKAHPRRPRGGQSGGRKGATKVFKHRRKSPWVPTLTGPFPNGQANVGSWLGTKNALYYCAQSANSISWVLFVSSYTTAIDSITACLAHALKKWTQSGNFQFDINSPFQILSTRKLKGLFQKDKFELTTGIHTFIDHAFVNIRELKMPRQLTAMKTSHEKVNSHFFSLYRDYSNSLTLSNASEPFWSWISVNHIQVHKEKEILSLLAFTSPSQNVTLGIFTW